jgi:hypothetical protein
VVQGEERVVDQRKKHLAIRSGREGNEMMRKKVIVSFLFFMSVYLMSCASHLGSTVISKPDEYTHVYEVREKIVLKAIASVIKEKRNGDNVTIDFKNNRVDSDYVVADDWRTKTSAQVYRLNWRECEVRLTVRTDKKTETGWETRRLLAKEQYDSFFSAIELKIYEEMSKIQ